MSEFQGITVAEAMRVAAPILARHAETEVPEAELSDPTFDPPRAEIEPRE